MRIKIPKYSIPRRRVKPTLLNIDDLLPHEEIIQERLNDLIKMILDLGAVDLPIIVAPIPESRKYLIVDGHHRWAALKKLGARRVPAIIIDYFNPEVKVYTWFPGIHGDVKEFLRRVKDAGISVVPLKGLGVEGLSINDVVSECRVNGEECSFIMMGSEGPEYKFSGWLQGQKEIVKVLDSLTCEGRLEMTWYGLMEDALRDLRSGVIDKVLLRRGLTKSEVMRIVRSGGVLPPKTTRHVLPFLPVKVYTKISELM